jgi:hypothetical protein
VHSHKPLSVDDRLARHVDRPRSSKSALQVATHCNPGALCLPQPDAVSLRSSW